MLMAGDDPTAPPQPSSGDRVREVDLPADEGKSANAPCATGRGRSGTSSRAPGGRGEGRVADPPSPGPARQKLHIFGHYGNR